MSLPLISGYVALTVVSATGIATLEIETKLDNREENMVSFAEEALKLLLGVLKGDVRLEEEKSNL